MLRNALADHEGVHKVSFHVVDGRMTVDADTDVFGPRQVAEAVSRLGMRAGPWDAAPLRESWWEAHGRRVPVVTSGLALVAGLVLHVAVAGGDVVETLLAHSHGAHDIDGPVAMLLLAGIVAGLFPSGRKAVASLIRLRPDMNALVLVSVVAALFLAEWAEAAVLAFLHGLSGLIENWSARRARTAIGTVDGHGMIELHTTRAASDTMLARITRMVGESHHHRAPTERFIDRFARYYTPLMFAVALAVGTAPPLLLGADWQHWFYQAMLILLISCPCGLVISTPVTIVAAITSATRHGVLIRGGSHLEELGRLRPVAFDKTGIVTRGEPEVRELRPVNAMGGNATDIAAEAADVVPMRDNDLRKLPFVVNHARRARRIIIENIAVALGAKAIFLAFMAFGAATLWMAVAADMGVSLLVTFNGLRMLRPVGAPGAPSAERALATATGRRRPAPPAAGPRAACSRWRSSPRGRRTRRSAPCRAPGA